VPRLRLRARPRLSIALPIAALSGGALSLAFPPAGIWPLAFVALVPLLWLLDDARPARGFWLGLAFGLAFHGATLYWIWRFGELAWTGLTLLSAAWIGLFGLLVPAVRRSGRPVVTVLGTAALWTALEWLKQMWPLGGFGWGVLGVSQADNRTTVRLATLAGVWGVTFAVVAVNALITRAIVDDGGAVRRSVTVLAALAIASAPVLVPFATADGRTLDVATIQVDVREGEAASGLEEDLIVAGLNLDQHAGLAGGKRPDLVVWGEGALDPGAAADDATMDAVTRTIAEVGAPTLIGAVTDDPDGRQRTTALLFDGTGALVDRYDKVHLVPFGEYVPFRDRLSFIDAIDQVPVDRAPGATVHTLQADGLPPFAAPICFENSFPDEPRAMVREGASFVVVPVNNASYGFTAASEQHLQMSQLRAIEDGRWFVNAAVSGISAFVDPSGRVVTSAGLFEPGVLRHTILASDEMTWYVRLGDWFPWLSVGLVVVALAMPRRRRRRGPAPAPLAPGARRTLVILPTYEERATIEQVLKGVRTGPCDVDALVIDDSSPDGTAEVVRDVMSTDPHIRLVQRPSKAGLAGAYLDGFDRALAEGYDLVVEMDSDLSHDPAELPTLIDAAAKGADLVVGSRYVPGGSVTNWSRSRVALSRAGNTYARLMLGIPLHDATSGFRVYRAGLLRRLLVDPIDSEGYGFQIELVLRAWKLGATLAEAPIAFREREHGHSKISRRIVVEALWLVTRWGLSARFRDPDATRQGRPQAEPP
jgi:apolipoprotein N-acyltransferase